MTPAAALVPFSVFAIITITGTPMPIAFLCASAMALAQCRGVPVGERIERYARHMGDQNILLMCLVFILAGLFAGVAKGTGAVDAAVAIAQAALPPRMMIAGMFLTACFLSLALGTSCGTIAALGPIALAMDLPPQTILGAVVGGAMFGDNLSIVSDTTIAATRTQGVDMRAKLIANLPIALPAAAATTLIYLLIPSAQGMPPAHALGWTDFLLVTPYLLVLALALKGIHVIPLLALGSALLLATGLLTTPPSLLWHNANTSAATGIQGMSETLIIALLAGGLLGTIRENGGISWLVEKIRARSKTERTCELGVAALTAAVNLCTANNTVAIVIVGPIARELSSASGAKPERIAGILDSTSCAIQGLIPYGAQILIALGLAVAAGKTLTPWQLVSHTPYPALLGVSLILSALTRLGLRAKSGTR